MSYPTLPDRFESRLFKYFSVRDLLLIVGVYGLVQVSERRRVQLDDVIEA